MHTTLNQIRKHSPCTSGWTKLLSTLGKTKADDEPLSIITILAWTDDTWCYRYELHEMRHMSDDYFVLQFASTDYIKFLEKEFPEDYD